MSDLETIHEFTETDERITMTLKGYCSLNPVRAAIDELKQRIGQKHFPTILIDATELTAPHGDVFRYHIGIHLGLVLEDQKKVAVVYPHDYPDPFMEMIFHNLDDRRIRLFKTTKAAEEWFQRP